jgi:hypothetical protein
MFATPKNAGRQPVAGELERNRSRAGGAGHSDLAGFPSPQRCRLE